MPVDNAVSGPEAGNAGDDAFTKAFTAAVESTSLDEDVYAPSAQAGAKEDTPVVSDSTEDAAKADPAGTDKAPKVEAKAPTTDIAAPAHWDAQKREAFGALPPEAKKIVNDLAKGFEADFTRKTTELAEDRKFAQGVKSLLNDNHRAQLRSAGMDEVAGIRHLISLNDFATRDAPGYARWVVQQTGLTPADVFPDQFAGTDAQQGEQPYQQPAPDNQLYAMLNALKQDVEGFKRSNEQQVVSQANRAIERFRTDTGEDGAARHPHFSRVENTMTQLLVTPAYQAIEDFGERLQKAYDVAVLMDPEIRTQIVDGDVQRRLKEQEQATNLAKARKAIAPVKATPTGSPKTKPGSIDEALSNAMSLHGV